MPQAHSRTEANTNLFDLAEGQQGYFTTKQAKRAGNAENTHPYHVKAGHWIRESRGIYRLRNFPISGEGQYVHYALWSQNRREEIQGVYSHETALSIHELSDLMPSKLHLSVPTSFRRNSEIPGVLVLHFQEIPKEDAVKRQGYLYTKPLRTLIDIIRENKVSPEFQKQALHQAIERGLITKKEIKNAKLTLDDRVAIEYLLNKVANG
ncbi:MAG: hypothetical protein RJB38_1720 [Pseudomonadota bacterium]|jgi:hypothetical protein